MNKKTASLTKEFQPNKQETSFSSSNSKKNSLKASEVQEDAKSSEKKEAQSSKRGKTRITIKYDVGFHNSLYIRGKGANLSWDRGIPLKNIGRDEWVWETDAPFTQCEFKTLINDQHYEQGENHFLTYGTSIQYTPFFG